MPTNNNQQGQSGTPQNSQLNGDILAQLAANGASTRDIYLLGRSMDSTVRKIEKNQAKTNSTLSELLKEFKAGHRAMSAVDNKLQQLINKVTGNNQPSSIPTPSPTPPPTGTTDLTTVESLLTKIEQTTFDIFTALGNRNSYSNNSRQNTQNPTPGSTTGNLPPLNSLQNQQYLLQVAQNAVDHHQNIRDALAAAIQSMNPTIGQRDLDEQLTDILHIITEPLDTAVTNQYDLTRLLERIQARVDAGWTTEEEADKLQLEATNNYMAAVLRATESQKSFFDNIKDGLFKAIPDMMKNAGSGQSIASDVINIGGGVVGNAVSGAIKVALPGVVGGLLGEYAEKIVGGLTGNLADYFGYLTTNQQAKRDEIIKSGFDKIRKDVNDMATYSIDIYNDSITKIYSAWDQNLGKITATQGYTKEALNTLQDAVAQRLQTEGYGNVINAADYITELSNTLNSRLGGELAEAFAAQNLILQKAVPEVNLSAMGETFASIYRNAELQGQSGEDTMIAAMNQIAGATKALEDMTSGNNQFISQIDNFLKKASEVVLQSGGSADQVADLATQMMAAEAPLAALAPQLNGFTSVLVDKLLSGNDATAVALRAIMNDIDNRIGVNETAFRQSFMEDTQGVLSTAFEAIGQFINDNSNEAAQFEFYRAMESVFGISANQLAQVDFTNIAAQVAEASTSANIKALTDAENLVHSGETTTLEEQLVANTSNQLLATNAIADTIDNRLMRKLEQNELTLERQIYVLQAEQVVNLAEHTMSYFTKFIDILRHAVDPLGLLDGLGELINGGFSAVMDAQKYLTTATASSVGSAVADSSAAQSQTIANTVGTAMQVGAQSILTLGQATVGEMESVVKNSGVVDSFSEMMKSQERTASAAQSVVSGQADMAASVRESATTQESLADSFRRTEDNIKATKEYQDKLANANDATSKYEQKRDEAYQQLRAQQAAEMAMTTANHDNIAAIRESVSKLDELSNYLSPILDENRNQSNLLQSLAEKVDKLVLAVTNKATQPAPTSVVPNVNTSYNERNRIYGPVKTW